MVLVTLQSAVCLKPFVKAVATLSKIGDEAFFEITDSALNLQAANSSTTAVIYFRFDRGFFSEYDSRTATVTRSQAAKSIGYAVKLSSRCLANSLKMVAAGLTGAAISGVNSTSADDSGSKYSSSLSVRYDTVTFECVHPIAGTSQPQQEQLNADFPDDDLTIRLFSSNSEIGRAKTTTFRLRPLDTSEMMAADFAAGTLRASTNHLSAPAKKFSDLLANFATSDRNLLFCMSPTRFSLAADPLGKSGRWHRIGTDVGPASIFTKYEVIEEVNFGCILAELKTFLAYAVSLDWSPMLHIDFSQPGRPIVFSVEVTDRLGFGDVSSTICMGSLVLSTMTLPAGVSAAAATAAPIKTPAAGKGPDKRQPQIDTALRSNIANRNAQQKARHEQAGEEEVIDLDRCPSPTIRSSLESRQNQPEIGNFPTAQSPSIQSRRTHPSMGVSLSDMDARRAPSPVSFLFAELFNSIDGSNRDNFMMPNDVLAGDSDPE